MGGIALGGGVLLITDDGLVNETLAKDKTLVSPLEAFFDNHAGVSDGAAFEEQ